MAITETTIFTESPAARKRTLAYKNIAALATVEAEPDGEGTTLEVVATFDLENTLEPLLEQQQTALDMIDYLNSL